jgi:hypothetical protein
VIVFDCCGYYRFVTKSYKFLIIFKNLIVVEILILKGIPGFTPFFPGSHWPVELNLAIELLKKL